MVFQRLRQANPAPYGALINLGEGEFLVAASPEMYVRVEGRRIETCPISGTIARGRDPIEDAERIRELLNSVKDESELTMCTDVDRNDKSRVSVPGSVRVIGRRQIEMYSRLIHTVDHVEGELAAEFDALDGFSQPRLGGDRDRRAKALGDPLYRGGGALVAPLVWRCDRPGDLRRQHEHRPHPAHDPHAGRGGRGARRRDAALRQRSRKRRRPRPGSRRRRCSPRSGGGRPLAAAAPSTAAQSGRGRRVLLIDHEDSFVHTLANYIRTTGAEVVTMRPGSGARGITAGGGFRSRRAVAGAGTALRFRDGRNPRAAGRAPAAGVRRLPRPAGDRRIFRRRARRAATPRCTASRRRSGCSAAGCCAICPSEFTVGRYHSLYARRGNLPAVLSVTAETADGVIMAIEHDHLCRSSAVQFHPESVMTSPGEVGMPIIAAVLSAI